MKNIIFFMFMVNLIVSQILNLDDLQQQLNPDYDSKSFSFRKRKISDSGGSKFEAHSSI